MEKLEASSKCDKGGGFKMHVALILAQVAFAGFEVLSRLSLEKGGGGIPFTFYRNCVATFLLAMASVLLERHKHPRISLAMVMTVFSLGFLGVTMNQVLYMVGLSFTSATFASALRNVTPILTFLLAVIFRMENVNFKRSDGVLKILGCMFGSCGAIILSIYEGPLLISSNFGNSRREIHTKKLLVKFHILRVIHMEMESWTLGVVCLLISFLAFAIFLILQAHALRTCPTPITLAACGCFSSLLQLPVLSTIYKTKRSKWVSISKGEGISIAYAGIIGSGFVSAIQSWGVHRGGPVIVAAYQPLETIFTTFIGFFVLTESLYLGSVVGGILVISGLYLLIWGQLKEHQVHELAPNTLDIYRDSAASFSVAWDVDIAKVASNFDDYIPSTRSSLELSRWLASNRNSQDIPNIDRPVRTNSKDNYKSSVNATYENKDFGPLQWEKVFHANRVWA